MPEKKISQKFRLKNMDKAINCCIKEIGQNKLMSEKHKKVCKTLNYTLKPSSAIS